VETAETRQITLGELPVGARLVVQCKRDWRGAVVSKFDDEKATLIVCSPSGGTYRLRRLLETSIVFDGKFPVLHNGCEEEDNDGLGERWREGFVKYDWRW
jgi:hypothetical protein